jgi:lipid A 4'-phosphatase
MINKFLVNTSIIFALLFSILLIYWPKIDLDISQFVFSQDSGFIYRNNYIVQFFYYSIPILTKIFVAICVVVMIYIGIRAKSIKKMFLSGAFFLFVSALIGPGLIVNSVMKENFGRARPSQITAFGGEKYFSKAFEFSQQCDHNCAFSSGHAAMGYYFTAIAYLFGGAYFSVLYFSGLVFGTAVGLSRILMGGHFASDVLVSCFIVLFINHIIFMLWQILKSKQIK